MQTPLSVLQHYWRYDGFRPMQEEIIHSVLDGNPTLALLPTGGGKSICFQVPGMLIDGLCVVISPLIALMRDQVDNLLQRDIPAVAIHSGLDQAAVRRVLRHAVHGEYKFLYLSPERLESTLFKEYLPALDIGLVVVDEAHCISQWGYDFRPPYLRIANLLDELPDVPVIALTASATPLVQDDIIDKLKFRQPKIFRQSFERPNLSYSCFHADSKFNKLMDVLQKVHGSSIVYVNSRRLTKELAYLLQLQGISADHYHAGLPQEDRENKQQLWIEGNLRVMVCTNAFGMGIDKPDVRSVIHYTIPECLENYYQEAGRAGRDGAKSYAVLLYQQEDKEQLESMPDKRFPPIAVIKEIYQSLADYLQIPVGLGEGNYYDFDFSTFTRNFNLDPLLVMNTLKVLELEGHLSFEETIFLPTQVAFTASRELLEAFETAHPELEPLIKVLLRTYEGIIDNRVSVFEKQIARLCRLSIDEVHRQLLQLKAYGIIEYLPQKETPQIHYLLNRAPAQYLYIDQDTYLLRKQQYTDRVKQMLQYTALSEACRSQFIARYFGDTAVHDCGICDNCLDQKKKPITPAEFKQIETAIREQLQNGIITTPLLLKSLHQWNQEKIWSVLEFLQSERIIVIDEGGKIMNSR